MKRILSIFLAMIITLSFAACSKDEPKPQENKKPSDNTSASKSHEPEQVKYERGTISDNVWESKYFNLKYTNSEKLAFLSDEEIARAMNLGSEMLIEDKETGKKMLNSMNTTVNYEFMTVNTQDNSNLSVLLEKLPVASLTEEQYIAAAKNNQSKMNATFNYQDIKTVEIGGIEFKDLTYVITVNGASYYQTMLFKKYDDRMLLMTATYFDADSKEILFGGFSELNKI